MRPIPVTASRNTRDIAPANISRCCASAGRHRFIAAVFLRSQPPPSANCSTRFSCLSRWSMDKHTLYETQLLELYRRMTLLRRFEEKVAGLHSRGKIPGHFDLYAGEEAVGVGAICALDLVDHVVSTYRQYGHCLAKGAAPRAVMAELFGKQTGISRGRGGAMHLLDRDLRFVGAIGAGGLPIAAGLALAVQYQAGPEVVCCLFGDIALSQGAFHEALNLASVWK